MTRAAHSTTLGLGVVTTILLGAWLSGRALATGTALAGSSGHATDLPDVVSALLLWAGSAAATWYALTCAAALLIRAGRAAGATTVGLEAAVRRWGFPILRRAALTTVAAGAGLSLTVGTAGAATSGDQHPLPQDLGWGASMMTEQLAAPGSLLGEAVRARPPSTAGNPSTASDEPTTPADAGEDAGASATGGPATAPPVVAPSAPAAGSLAAPAQAPAAPALPAPSAPNVTTAQAASPASTSRPTASLSPDGTAQAYRVRAGDSLWSIAATHLGESATDEEVAQAWPEWYRANRALLGPDPHLIHPGQLLHVPDEEAS